MNKLMAIFDGMNTDDNISMSGHAFNTSIDIKNLETGEIIFKGLKNKVIISGSGLVARKLFDISNPEVSPSYNTIFGNSMYTPDVDSHDQETLNGTKATKEEPKVVLFCCGIDGCGTENSQVYPVDYTKWITPENMIPGYFFSLNSMSLKLLYPSSSSLSCSSSNNFLLNIKLPPFR